MRVVFAVFRASPGIDFAGEPRLLPEGKCPYATRAEMEVFYKKMSNQRSPDPVHAWLVTR